MKKCQSLFHCILVGLLVGVTTAGLSLGLPMSATAASAASIGARRTTLAITYGEGTSTRVDMMGSGTKPGVVGSAEVKRDRGRTRVHLHMEALPHPQSLGSFYTTYVLWAVAPEGQAVNLAELPHSKGFDTEVTTSFPTFGLIVTAEPHSAVALPSPLILAANVAREDTAGTFHAGSLEYSGAVYLPLSPADVARRDYTTPLLVLGAHRAVDLAKASGAADYATDELQPAELKLATLDRAWPMRGRSLPKDLEGVAHEVMRMAEHARTVTEERREQAKLAGERDTAKAQVAHAENAADRAREEAEQARARAEREQASGDAARRAADEARNSAEQARAREDVAVAQAAQARQEAEQAKGDKEELQQRLFQSLSAILETRREARGLIVSLSDVLFDFDRASLTPGAREKLSKLVGVLVAYAGHYRVVTEGHTDSIGSHEYNQRLSRDRAESVQSYLLAGGIPAERMGSAVGFGETRPVATNDTASGRQMNRRVEIVISDLDN
jgi:outer membrane protein OmpA-like peptidoglycan-associated protein